MQNEWQPIETAPRDGTKFLGYCGNTIIISHWDDMEWAAQKPSFFPVSIITHWMPLPEAPKEKNNVAV